MEETNDNMEGEQIKKWYSLAEEFLDRIKSKYPIREKKAYTLGEIIRELNKFKEEKNLDFFDTEAILGLCFGIEEGKFINTIYKKQFLK